jgi:hypothetical protein
VEKRFHFSGREIGKGFQRVLVGKVDFERSGMMFFCLSDEGRRSDVKFSFHPSVEIDILFLGEVDVGIVRGGLFEEWYSSL